MSTVFYVEVQVPGHPWQRASVAHRLRSDAEEEAIRVSDANRDCKVKIVEVATSSRKKGGQHG